MVLQPRMRFAACSFSWYRPYADVYRQSLHSLFYPLFCRTLVGGLSWYEFKRRFLPRDRRSVPFTKIIFLQNEISVGQEQYLLSKSLSGESLLVMHIYVRIPPSIQCPPLDIQMCIGTRLLHLKPLHPAPKILWSYS